MHYFKSRLLIQSFVSMRSPSKFHINIKKKKIIKWKFFRKSTSFFQISFTLFHPHTHLHTHTLTYINIIRFYEILQGWKCDVSMCMNVALGIFVSDWFFVFCICESIIFMHTLHTYIKSICQSLQCIRNSLQLCYYIPKRQYRNKKINWKKEKSMHI